MDGVVDSGVSLNGDSSCGPDSGDHIQNQQVCRKIDKYLHLL